MPRFAANLSYDPLKPLKPVAAPGGVLEAQQLQQQLTNPSWQQTHSIDIQGKFACRVWTAWIFFPGQPYTT